LKTIKTQLNDLDFLLSHLSEPHFPRTIYTHQKPYQFSVTSKQELFDDFERAEFKDCKINAFPSLKEGVSWTPDFIFIDLDLADFKSKRALDLALNKTLKNIREKLKGYPTVLFSGGGYHIYQPIEGIILEKYRDFNEYNEYNLFNEFLRFSKKFLSNGKADKQNNPSLKSCLLRIPNTINSKHQTKVSIIQKWDGCRPHIRLLIGDFHAYLIDKRDIELRNKLHSRNNIQTSTNIIPWIEKLLETPIEDGRKYALWRILCPYLANIRKLEYEESFKILKTWLEKCNRLRELSFNADREIKIKLRSVKQYNPISIKTLENDHRNLYLLLRKVIDIF
jgi:hypothetical protein